MPPDDPPSTLMLENGFGDVMGKLFLIDETDDGVNVIPFVPS